MSNIIERFQAWKQEKFRSFRGWINLEIAVSYRFPVPEGVVSIFLFVVFSSVSSLEILDVYALEYISFQAYAQGAFSVAMVSVIIAPMFLSHTFVREFSDGTMKTYLSYPISRFNIMVLKVYLPTIFLGYSTTIPLVLYIHFAFVGTAPLTIAILYTSALWVAIIFVAGVTSLIAVISKNIIATSFVSIAITYSLSVAGITNYNNPYIIQGLFNPVYIVTSYFLGVLNPDMYPPPPTILDVVGSFFGAITIGIGLLILSLYIFKMREI